jgi:restriction endonuclease Mrr
MAYSHTNSKGVTYYLHRTAVTLSGGQPQEIYFFAKIERNEKGEPSDLPVNREVKENPANGFLTISNKVTNEDEPPLPAVAPPVIAPLIRRFAEDAARLVADNPAALDDLEWRDLERMMTAVLDGLGFSAELTPASKDGGKDIILNLKTELGSVTYVIELKHWRSGKRVGGKFVRDFVNVVARECRHGGLFLSTSGYAEDAFQTLTEIERKIVRFAGKTKVINLCRSYVKIGTELWQPTEESLAELLSSDTIAI